ncbi:MAG TPA: DUF5131 family protein [Gammaproteobacteria bacterium]|nr:DUF5131 family protein [Gammaproteobacteria bacterium]
MAGTPPTNVWLGATVVNQEEADRDIPKLLKVPAHVRFLSCEPLLGPVDLDGDDYSGPGWLRGWHCEPERDRSGDPVPTQAQNERVDWCITGGESGPHARPSHPDWFRSIRDQCAAAGVPYLHKQNGEWAPGECAEAPPTRTERMASYFNGEWHYGELTPRQSEETHVVDEPDLFRLGKKAAGRHLDGRIHEEFPR